MRRTAHRRRFHTDRIVAVRRWRFFNEWPPEADFWSADDARFAYGRLDDRDPWDCGRSRCGVCHDYKKRGEAGRERRRQERLWRGDWGV